MTGSHIDLFSGVGMTSLAIEASGYRTIATAEIDPFARSVLRQRFPRAISFADVRQVTIASDEWSRGVPRPLLISGGFPCQDVAAPSSTQTGIRGARTGLWTEFARVIREFEPDTVLIENSNMLRTRGLDVLLSDLDERGYNARWDCIPASAVGAPHRRDRMWIVAERRKADRLPDGLFSAIGVVDRHWRTVRSGGVSVALPRAGRMKDGFVFAEKPLHTVKDSAKVPTLGRMYPTITLSDGTGGPGTTPKRTGGKNLRTVMHDLEGNGRINPQWGEWLMGLPMGWTDPTVDNSGLLPHGGWAAEPRYLSRTVTHRAPNRAKRIKALGNGLVPQVAQLALFELSTEGSI